MFRMARPFRISAQQELALVLGLQVLSLLITYYLFPPDSDGDALIQQTARALARGDGYTACKPDYFPYCSPGDPTAAREPLPVILFAAALRLSLPPAIIQAVLNLGTTLLIYKLSCLLFFHLRVALISATLWAIYLPMLKFTLQYRSEPTFALTLALTLFTLINALRQPAKWRFVVAGGYFGLAVLSRSALLYSLTLLPLAFYFAAGRALRQTLGLVAFYMVGVGLVLAPWIVRNALVFDGFVPASTLNGYNLLRGNYRLIADDYFRHTRQSETVDVIQQLLARRADIQGDEDELEMDRIYRDEALRIIRAEPLRYLSLTVYRLVLRAWFDVGVSDIDTQHRAIILSNLILLPLAIWDIVRLPRNIMALAWPLVGALLYFSLVYPLVIVQFRFMVPVMPYVMLFAVHRLVTCARLKSAS